MSERQTPQLIRLKNGDWVDPLSVDDISAKFDVQPKVIVKGVGYHDIAFPTVEDAIAYADELGEMINRARAGMPIPVIPNPAVASWRDSEPLL